MATNAGKFMGPRRIDGFHGRLGNLGTIDQKYDVAVSTACSALDNFVTESVESGQQCIEYLRKNNLGRGNFICLDKLRSRDMSPIQTPENAPRLFDLVKSKDKFRPAFYHAMQDTLVANDFEQKQKLDGAVHKEEEDFENGHSSVLDLMVLEAEIAKL